MTPPLAAPNVRRAASGRRVVRRARWTLVAAATLAALLVLPGSAPALTQKLTDDGSANGRFGQAVDVDGDTAVVGAPQEAGLVGAVYVFTRTGNTWVNTAKLTASDAGAHELGGSVAIEGDTIVAGAENAGNGAVYTFARTGAAVRHETAKLTASDGAPNDHLGSAVAIAGDTIVGGAYTATGIHAGAVYTFTRSGAAARTQTAKLTASDGATGDGLGRAVAVDGDTIVAGASFDDIDGVADKGSVYTFTRTGPALRAHTAKLTLSAAAGSQFGRDVAIDGDTIVAGHPNATIDGKGFRGAAYTRSRPRAPSHAPKRRR